ncbi:MAG: tyrosine-type recombinase/integrase, partial [Myxococcales bacterium]|nr:tyrosine-type recombinase/integrase [Myxococcales bacterium]
MTFMEACRADRLGKNTLRNYDVHLRVHILPVVGDRRLDELGERDLVELKTRLLERARSTAAEVLKTLKAILGRAIRLGVLERMPVPIEIPRRIRKEPIAYTPEEVELLLGAAANDPQLLAAVLLGLDGGLRRGEILALRWEDVDFNRATLTVRTTLVGDDLGETTKGHADGVVGVTARLAAALQRLGTRSARGFVLADTDGSHWDERIFTRRLRQLVRAAEIRWLGSHVLRRTCATRIAEAGGGVAAIAAHLRHAGLQMAS